MLFGNFFNERVGSNYQFPAQRIMAQRTVKGPKRLFHNSTLSARRPLRPLRTSKQGNETPYLSIERSVLRNTAKISKQLRKKLTMRQMVQVCAQYYAA